MSLSQLLVAKILSFIWLRINTSTAESIPYSKSESKINHIEPTKFHNIVQVRNSFLDITKLSSYGFKIKYDINTIIKKLVVFYKAKK